MNILVTLNKNYLFPLKVMLKSLFINNPGEAFTIYLMQSDLTDEDLMNLDTYIKDCGHEFVPISIAPDMFEGAPVFRHYSIEMYYRLAAHKFLPETLDRILYLDPDIIVLNPISDFYHQDFKDCMFVAAEHEHSTKVVSSFNKFRLKTPLAKGYFNTGVLLMNLNLIRKNVHLPAIYSFIEENKYRLFLPDQDILNALYWDKILPADGFRYNYDARYYELSKLLPTKKNSIEWIEKNTVFLHFCGKDKPWHEDYKGDLRMFYKKYERLVQ